MFRGCGGNCPRLEAEVEIHGIRGVGYLLKHSP